MPALDPIIYRRVADFIRGAVQNIFDSRFDWTPDAESILVLMRDGGVTQQQESRFRPYFDLFVDQCHRGEMSGFNPRVDLDAFEEYPPVVDLDRLLAAPTPEGEQGELFADIETPERALIDQLIADTQLYRSGADLEELFAFTAKMRNMAPFNAMLLHSQKPGISYAMTAKDWRERFGRVPKAGARPLVILQTFGPVNFVFDMQDTDGPDPPEGALSFPTEGKVPPRFMADAADRLHRDKFEFMWLDRGDRSAGYALRLENERTIDDPTPFRIAVNRNHSDGTQVVTLVHELAHVFLGHCGADPARKIKPYRPSDLALREIEAESVAYVIAKRSGLSPRSDAYLDTYKDAFIDLDVHRVLTCANRIERLLGMPFDAEDVM